MADDYADHDYDAQIERAWAAGFFDGEGYIAFRYASTGKGRWYRRIEIQVTQCDPFVLERFARAVGVGRVYGPYEAGRKANHSPQWKYQIAGGPTVKSVIDQLKDFLSPVKLEQARVALRLFETSPISSDPPNPPEQRQADLLVKKGD